MNESLPVIAVLASGAASRFGGGKLQAQLDGKPLAKHAIDAALSHNLPVAIVARANDEAQWSENFPACQIIANPIAARGIGTSIRGATEWAMSRGANGMVLLLADMPFVPEALIGNLIEATLLQRRAACRYPKDAIGMPAAFPKADFPEIAQIADHTGAKHLLAEPSTLILRPPPVALIDIDTQAELVKANERVAQSCAS